MYWFWYVREVKAVFVLRAKPSFAPLLCRVQGPVVVDHS